MQCSTDDRATKKSKIEEVAPDLLLLPLEVLQIIIKYLDVKSTAILLQSTKLAEGILTQKSWKLLYLWRWYKKSTDNSINTDIDSKYFLAL
jgi:hypothetical protein